MYIEWAKSLLREVFDSLQRLESKGGESSQTLLLYRNAGIKGKEKSKQLSRSTRALVPLMRIPAGLQAKRMLWYGVRFAAPPTTLPS